MVALNRGYLNNPFLKQAGEQIPFDKEKLGELMKCSQDPIYFLETYGKIVSLDDGVVPFKLFPYQKRIIRAIQNNKKVIGKIGRQLGKSTVVAGFISWYVLFHDNKNCAILANKQATAKEIFSRVQFILENTPKWLQQGVKEWNKTSLSLENGSRVFASGTSPSAVRGSSISLLFLDEFAFLRPSLADEFIASVFPTISSSESSKMVIVSTPKGLNHYYKIWTEAEKGTNGFFPVAAHWSEHPRRSQAWADEQLKELGPLKFNQEVLCEFLGSSAVLVDAHKVSSLPIEQGSDLFHGYVEYNEPIKDTLLHSYTILVDVSRGANLDYSVASVIDISVVPYKLVAKYRSNTVNTLVFPSIINNIAKRYNDAFVLIETNDLGQEVANILYHDLEYENMYFSAIDKISDGGGMRRLPGVRTTKKTKSIGCDRLKTLIENDQLLITDFDTISELSTFIRVGSSYKAEEGKHDDCVMVLVMFGYLTSQPVFKDLFDYSLRQKFVENQLKELDEAMCPIGFFDDGAGDVFEMYSSPGRYVENKDDVFNF